MATKAERLALYWERAENAKGEYSLRDELLRALEPYYFLDYPLPPGLELEEGVEHVEMPWGTNAIDLVHDLLSVAGYSMSVPSLGPEKTKRTYAEVQEKYVRAVFDESARIQQQDLLSRAASGGAMRGAVCGRVVHQPEALQRAKNESGKYKYSMKVQGKVPLQVQLRDPLEVWPVFGRDGLSWVIESQERKVRDVQETYGKDILEGLDENSNVTWTEYWDREEYCYWADGKPISMGRGKGVPGPWKHRYGGMPYVWEFCRQTLDMRPERRTRPLLSGLTKVIERADMLDSMEMTFISNYIGTPWVAQSVGPEKIKMSTKPGSTIHIKEGESIRPLQSGRTPLELQEMQSKLSAHFERGTFPGSMYGTDPGRVMAGYAIAMLNQSGQARINPIIAGVERCVAGLAEKVLMVTENYLQKRILEGPVPFFWYEDSEDEETGDEYVARQDLKFDASKLEGVYRVSVTLGDIMPADEASKMSLAQAARTPGVTGRPLMSDQTIQEKYILVESPSDERKRIDEELAEASPELAALDRAIAIATMRKEKVAELDKLGVDIDQVLEQIATGQPVTAALMDMELPQELPPGALPQTPQAVGGSMQAVGAGEQIPGLPPTMPTEVGQALGALPMNPEEVEPIPLIGG